MGCGMGNPSSRNIEEDPIQIPNVLDTTPSSLDNDVDSSSSVDSERRDLSPVEPFFPSDHFLGPVNDLPRVLIGGAFPSVLYADDNDNPGIPAFDLGIADMCVVSHSERMIAMCERNQDQEINVATLNLATGEKTTIATGLHAGPQIFPISDDVIVTIDGATTMFTGDVRLIDWRTGESVGHSPYSQSVKCGYFHPRTQSLLLGGVDSGFFSFPDYLKDIRIDTLFNGTELPYSRRLAQDFGASWTYRFDGVVCTDDLLYSIERTHSTVSTIHHRSHAPFVLLQDRRARALLEDQAILLCRPSRADSTIPSLRCIVLFEEENRLGVGLQSGEVILIDLRKTETPFARVSVCRKRSPVLKFEKLKNRSDCDSFATVTEAGNVCFVRSVDGKVEWIRSDPTLDRRPGVCTTMSVLYEMSPQEIHEMEVEVAERLGMILILGRFQVAQFCHVALFVPRLIGVMES